MHVSRRIGGWSWHVLDLDTRFPQRRNNRKTTQIRKLQGTLIPTNQPIHFDMISTWNLFSRGRTRWLLRPPKTTPYPWLKLACERPASPKWGVSTKKYTMKCSPPKEILLLVRATDVYVCSCCQVGCWCWQTRVHFAMHFALTCLLENACHCAGCVHRYSKHS